MPLTLHICRALEQLACSVRVPSGFGLVKRSFSSQKMGLPKISSVVFDFDGVILDTETIFYETNTQSLKHYGVEYNIDLKLGQMGRKLNEGTEWLLKQTGLDKKGVTVDEYIKLYDQILEKQLDNPLEMPGARKLINHLHSHKVPIAICTGSASDEFRLKIRKCQHLIEKFPLIVLAGDDPEVKNGKPAPDPYLVTMRRMRPPPTDPKSVLVFEDSLNGVLSAAAANNTVVWIPQEQFKPKNWDEIRAQVEPKCSEILTSMEKFDPTKYGLPPY